MDDCIKHERLFVLAFANTIGAFIGGIGNVAKWLGIEFALAAMFAVFCVFDSSRDKTRRHRHGRRHRRHRHGGA